MKKNVTLIGVNYYPEDSAIGLYSTQKAEYLAKKGFQVSVVTGFPYYPQWKINEIYQSKKSYYKETINGVSVYRYKQYVPSNPTFAKRIVHLLSFTFGSLINAFKPSTPNIVIIIIPFTSSMLLGWLLKIRYKAKLWVHIQDFEFDAAIDSGLVNNNKSTFIKFLFWLEKSLLEKADVISAISNSMLAKLKIKTGLKGYYLTNWLDVSKFATEFPSKHHYLNTNKFKILYSGNIGAKQDWDFFFIFLDKLKTIKNIEVIVVGEGAEQLNVKAKLDTYNFTKHYNLVSFKELPQLLSSADLHILFQKDNIIDTVMPSKILGMMGSGRPSILTGNEKSEVKEIFMASKGGFYFQNNQLLEIIDAVKKLQSDKRLRDELGANAKQFIIEKYSKERVLDDFVDKLIRL